MWLNDTNLRHYLKEKTCFGALLTFRCLTESNLMSQYEATFVL